MTRTVALAVISVCAAAAVAVYWTQTAAYQRALAEPTSDHALEVLGEHAHDPQAQRAVQTVFHDAVYASTPPRPAVIAAARKIAEVQPPDSDTVAACVVRHHAVECRELVSDYDTNPAITAALIRQLQRAEEDRERSELAAIVSARPRTQATLDVLIVTWRRAPAAVLVPLILAYDYSLVSRRFEETSKLGAEEARLLLCQAGNCQPQDLEPLVKLVRARVTERAPDDDRDADLGRLLVLGPEEAWTNATRTSRWLSVECAAFVRIGKPAIAPLLSLYEAPSRALWSFAAMAIAEIDADALLTKVKAELTSKHAGAPEKAILALSAIDGPAAAAIYGLAAVHPNSQVAEFARKKR